MSDAVVVGRLLREYHLRGAGPAALCRVGGALASGVVTYLVSPEDGTPWVARACRQDAPLPPHAGGAPAMTMLDWLLTRASVLECLAGAGYPAPRVIRTHSGDPVGMDGLWLTLATSFVEGPVIRPSLAQLRMLGAALGRLHALDVGGHAGDGVAGGPGRASWYPEEAIPTTLARLDAVEVLVPDDWQDLYAQFRRTALAVQGSLGGLPRGVVHGDAWPGNAVQSGPGSVTLIDWETSGLGLPVLDLGNCLMESLLDARPSGPGPEARLVEPDEGRIAAVAAGYAGQRLPGEGERALLPEAVRFGACYAGAVHLHEVLAEGLRGAAVDARMERLRNRVAVSEAVARLAARHLTGHGGGGEAEGAGGAGAGGAETVR